MRLFLRKSRVGSGLRVVDAAGRDAAEEYDELSFPEAFRIDRYSGVIETSYKPSLPGLIVPYFRLADWPEVS